MPGGGVGQRISVADGDAQPFLDGIELVTGTDWQGVRAEPLPTTTTSTTLPAPTTTTSTTTTEAGGAPPPTGSGTTTTVDLATLEC